MNQNAYDQLALRMEADWRDAPAAFRRSVIAACSIPQVVLLLSLMGLVGTVQALLDDGFFHTPLLSFLMVVVWLTFVALGGHVIAIFATRIAPPKGRALKAVEAPGLFDALARLRKASGGPRVHRVLVDKQFHLTIQQVPFFGLFGVHRNYLVVGLPYLLGTPVSEIESALAHEYALLAGTSDKVGAWVYRQRRTFNALLAQRKQKKTDNRLSASLVALLAAQAPRFNAATRIIAREQVFLADAAACAAAGKTASAARLVREAVLGKWFAELFWRGFFAQAKTVDQPRTLPYASMHALFTAGHGEWAQSAHLRSLLRVENGGRDARPCLEDRLDAMKAAPFLPPPADRVAADDWLADAGQSLVAEFDQRWWQKHQAAWLQSHLRHNDGQRRQEAADPEGIDAMPTAELLELTVTQARMGDRKQVLALVEKLLARPDAPVAQAEMIKGRLLLARGDRGGLDCLARAVVADPAVSDGCLHSGYRFLIRADGQKAADDWVKATSAKITEVLRSTDAAA